MRTAVLVTKSLLPIILFGILSNCSVIIITKAAHPGKYINNTIIDYCLFYLTKKHAILFMS